MTITIIVLQCQFSLRDMSCSTGSKASLFHRIDVVHLSLNTQIVCEEICLRFVAISTFPISLTALLTWYIYRNRNLMNPYAWVVSRLFVFGMPWLCNAGDFTIHLGWNINCNVIARITVMTM